MRYQTQDPRYDIEVGNGGACLVDAKTGKPIPLDCPVFILRADDNAAVHALSSYAHQCDDGDVVEFVEDQLDEFKKYQMARGLNDGALVRDHMSSNSASTLLDGCSRGLTSR